ncbi:MAG: MBL fold metallo-hydrolase [archaeon]
MLRETLIIGVVLLFLSACAAPDDTPKNKGDTMNIDGIEVDWLNHASVKIKGSKTVYFDPYNIKEDDKADLILITHAHYDHCSINDIKKVAKEDTIIVTVADCQSKLSGLKVKNITLVKPGNKVKIGELIIEVVPAYNINKSYHPKENEWVGFVLQMDGRRFYHAGDTDKIPEMANLKDIDVAFLPVAGTFTMDAKEAAEACALFKPKKAVPIHYGDIVGDASDARMFKSLVKDCEVEILG